ncbi:MAG: AAA family ATPase, partial [Candidatus Altiarchaeales archaeon]|nr:AAA family ATPase [Candidatus Altiarchaeales archaeon]
MRLLDLELKNWSCHEHLHISLADGLQIEGRNGTGKSSILDAIRFIFSESARGYRNKIKNGARTSIVKLEFKDDGSRYVVEKRLFLNKQSTAYMTTNSTQIADNPTTVHHKLQNILSENILDKLLYVPQGGLTELINNLQRMGGKKELDSLLGLDQLEKVYEGAKKELGELKIKSGLQEEQLKKYPENADIEYQEEINKHMKEKEKLRKEIDAKLQAKEKLSSQTNKLKEKIKTLQEIKQKITGYEKNLNQLNIQTTEKRKDLEMVNQKLQDIRKRRDELVTLEADEEKLGKYVTIKKHLTELVKKKDKLTDIGDLTELGEKIRHMREEITLGKEVQGRYDEEANKVIEVERKAAARKEKLRELREYLGKLTGLVGQARCPRCGQKLTKEHMETENSIANNKISQLKEELGSLDEELSRGKQRLAELARELEALSKKKIEAGHLKKELREKHSEQENLRDNIRHITADLENSSYAGENIDVVEDKITRLNRTQERITLYRQEIRREQEYTKRKEETEKELFRASERRKEIKEELSKLKYDETEYSELEKEKDDMQEKYYNIKSVI